MRLSLPSSRLVSLFALLGALLMQGATAVAPSLTPGSASPEITADASTDELGMTVVRVRGMWPTPCLPTVEHIDLSGRELRIDARSNQNLCRGPSMVFDLSFDPLAQFGHNLDAGVYRINLNAANGALASLQPRGFALVEIGKLAPVRPESGFWWPEAGGEFGADARGTSLSLEVQGNTLAAALLSYSAEGDARWSFGTAAMRERSAEIDLIGMRDGSALLDSGDRKPRPTEALTLHLEFLGNARASAWISRHVPGPNQGLLQLRPLSLVRLPFSATTEAGSWRGHWLLLRGIAGQPQASTALRLDFSQTVQVDDEQFRLIDNNGYQLQCRRHYRAPQSPPEQCSLNDAAGNRVGRFNAVGLNRLNGTDEAGAPLEMLRSDPH